MSSFDRSASIQTHGPCQSHFAKVRDAFKDNFRHRNEIGAAVCIIHNGEIVVDLWAGFKDQAQSQPWEKDTLVCVMSTTKAIASIAVLSLVDKGLLSLDSPIANYWPEFAQAGKEFITVKSLLTQLAGLPVVDGVEPDSYFKHYEAMEPALAAQAPFWEPDSTPCYHSFTYGPLCQVLIKKVTGKSLGTYLREELLNPLHVDFFIGLTDEEIQRCADIILQPGIPTLEQIRTPGTLLNRAWQPLKLDSTLLRSKAFRCGEFASGNGHSNARGLAQIYDCLCQDYHDDAHRLLHRRTLRNAIKEQWHAQEKISLRRFRYGTGFMLNNQHFHLGSNPNSFGHPGLGGPLGFADPDKSLAFGYCCNHIKAFDDIGPCASALIQATYECLG